MSFYFELNADFQYPSMVTDLNFDLMKCQMIILTTSLRGFVLIHQVDVGIQYFSELVKPLYLLVVLEAKSEDQQCL